jgi:hypothetical protein
MVDISNAAEDLFFKLRNRFPKINMGDENGSSTVDPEAARFFNFVYTDKESKRGYGNVTCSIIDNSSLKVYFDTQITENMLPDDKKYWFEFLKELRRMAKGHMLNFDVRDITKDVLSRQDLQYMTKLNPEKKSIRSESIMEGKVLWNRRGKVIACICHGAQLLISAKIVKGRDISGYYSIKDDIENAGARYVDAAAVVSDNIVTSPHYKHMGPWMKRAIDLVK